MDDGDDSLIFSRRVFSVCALGRQCLHAPGHDGMPLQRNLVVAAVCVTAGA
jgi:hypothetical protein